MRDGLTKVGQCPYCLREFPDAEMTDDHVIARSWFPANTPPVAKWEVRSCQACNNNKSALEGDLLGRLAWSLDPNDRELADIVRRARRSVDPRCAKTRQDFIHRFNRREAVRRSIVNVQSRDAPGLLPSFARNFDTGSRNGMWVPAQSLDRLVQMWIRGIHLCEVGWIIPAGYAVSVMHIDDQIWAEAVADIVEHARVIQKGPGVEVAIFRAEDGDEFMMLYALNMWNALRCSASVERLSLAHRRAGTPTVDTRESHRPRSRRGK